MHLFMTTDTVGGVWTYTSDLVEAVLAKSIEVTLVSFGRELSYEQVGWADSLAETYGQRFRLLPTTYKLEWMPDSSHDIAISRCLVGELIRDLQPDACHFNQFCFGVVDTGVPKIVVAHSDVVSWWWAVHGCAPPASEWAEYCELVADGLAGADIVIAPSNWMADQLRIHYSYRPPCRVIYNGTRAMPRPSKGYKKLQACSLGRIWDKGKNIRLLERVRAPFPIYVGGDQGGENRADGLQTAPVYLGQLSRTAAEALQVESAIYILCSTYEPFGLAAIEAAFSGCAVVANDIPSTREIWGDAATYFKNGDASDLAACLRQLAEDAELLAGAQERAFLHATSSFTLDRMVASYIGLYAEACRASEVIPQHVS